MLDVCGNQSEQRLLSAGETIAQAVADFFDRHALASELFGLDRLAGAGSAMRTMIVAVTIEQVFMAVGPVTSTVAMHLRKQGWIALRDLIGLFDLAHEQVGIQSEAQFGGRIVFRRKGSGRGRIAG